VSGFRDRFFTPKVFRALWSPISIGVLVVVAVIAAVAGVPLVAAIPIGVTAYAVRVLLAVPRAERSRRIDPFVLSEPWRRYVQGALSAKSKFDRTVKASTDGPIKDRLLEMAQRLDDAVQESWRIASKGDDIDAALARLDTPKARRELDRLRTSPGADAGGAATVQSLEATIAAADRLEQTSASTRSQLTQLDVRLDELVARAAEVSVGAADERRLGHDVDEVVTSLEALRLALEETRQADEGPGEQPQTWPPR
jgi:hypothetical protein